MKISENVPLSTLTTFKLGGPARFLIDIESVEDVREAIVFARGKGLPALILGGGSNILAADEGSEAVFLRMRILGVSREERGADVFLRVGAGEEWDKLVAYAVSQNLWGIENLSGIPGTVGAAPIQNIGAYGTELSDTLASVEVFNLVEGVIEELPAAQCDLSYRSSLFKKEGRGKYVILSVTLHLKREGKPQISYKDLKAHFGESIPTLPEIREAVLAIRSRKFPDLTREGTAGSFFKNPLLTRENANALLLKFPDLPHFLEGDSVKIPLAWILDKILSLKGEKRGKVRAYEAQPLVLVSEAGATSSDVRAFALGIAARVKEKTGIEIEPEVCVMKGETLAHEL